MGMKLNLFLLIGIISAALVYQHAYAVPAIACFDAGSPYSTACPPSQQGCGPYRDPSTGLDTYIWRCPASSGSDSSVINPTNIEYTSQSVNSTPIPNYDYSGAMTSNPPLLPECTDDQPTLPDINSKMPNNGNPPPDQCYVKSRVNCSGTVDCADPTQTITSVSLAVCPSNYTQVGAFDIKPEVRYKGATTLNSPDEITNMADWQFYTAQGFDCSAREWNNSVILNMQVCIPSDNHPLNEAFVYNFNHGVGSIFELPNTNGVVFLSVSKSVSDNGFYSSQNCTGAKQSTSTFVQYSPSSTGLSNHEDDYPVKITFTTRGSLWLNFPYVHVKCTGGPNSNWYFTPRMAPRGLICAKIQSSYHRLNK